MLKLTRGELRLYSLGGLLTRLHEGKGNAGFEDEIAAQLARDAAKTYDPLRPAVPWQVLSRTLTVGTPADGGYTVATGVLDAADVLRPVSVAVRAGAQVLSGLTSSMIAPRVSGSATAAWLTNETTQVSDSDITFAAKTLAPKNCAAHVKLSRQLDLQSAQVDSLVGQHLLRLIGATLDAGVLAGSGTNGEPQGLLNATGLQAQSGTTLALAGVVNMREQCVTNGANDDNVVFVAVPTVAEILQKRDVGTDTGVFVWTGDQVAGRRAYATTSMPAQAMVAGDFRNLLIGLFGAGPELMVDPYTGFQTGTIGVRCFLSMDLVAQAPGAFCKSTSIT